jgi:hypothetical protein
MFKAISKRQYVLYQELEKYVDLVFQKIPEPLLDSSSDEEPISTAQRIGLLKVLLRRIDLGVYTKSLKSRFSNNKPVKDYE